MNKFFFWGACFLGVLAVLWVGFGFLDTHGIALWMTTIIGAVYAVGTLELRSFRQANASLEKALKTTPDELAALEPWIANVHASLQGSVRLRIEGERVALPGPALTPYLVGLLVMLGMLGTFLGMVVTLNGTIFALENTTDAQAIREAFSAPIKGLGLAFGTSVAGVATSAMLGLMSALSRRDRTDSAQLLDTKIATVFRIHSIAHQRQETFKALQIQSQNLPLAVDAMHAMMVQMERMSQRISEGLLNGQDRFHSDVKKVYTELANEVNHSLRDSLAYSAQLAGESIRPSLETALAAMVQESRLVHEQAIQTTQGQLESLSKRLDHTASNAVNKWTAALADQERTNANMASDLRQSLQAFGASFEHRSETLLASIGTANSTLQANQAEAESQRLAVWADSVENAAAELLRGWQNSSAQTLAQQQQICTTLASTAQEIATHSQESAGKTLNEMMRLVTCSEDLMRSRIDTEAHWAQQHREHFNQIANTLRTELSGLRSEEAARGHAAVERLGELQSALSTHLSTLGAALEAPLTRLMQTASEAPRAAAEVIGELRREISGNLARDNALLEERSRIMAALNSMLDAIHHTSAEQRSVIDALVASSASALNQVSQQFSATVDAEATQLSGIAANVISSAVDVASLSDSFSFAVGSFADANEKLILNLQRIEAAMDKSMTRSDEQLAYYVAQAREIIDLSILSHKDVFDELRQLPNRQPLAAQGVA